MPKVMYTEGLSGFLVEGTELTHESASFGGGFAIIKAKGAASYFDTVVDTSLEGAKALEVDMPVYLKAWTAVAQNPLKEGDIVIPFDMRTSCWITDTPNSVTEGTVDLTSQCDWLEGRRDIKGDGNYTDSGSVNGYFESESEMQKQLGRCFRNTVVHSGTGDATKISWLPIKSDKTFWHFLITRRTDVVGETEVTIIRKMLINGIHSDVPSSGGVPFNYDYTTLAAFRYEREVAA